MNSTRRLQRGLKPRDDEGDDLGLSWSEAPVIYREIRILKRIARSNKTRHYCGDMKTECRGRIDNIFIL